MIAFLLTFIAVVVVLQLLAMLALLVAIHHDTRVTQNLHTTVDDVQTGLVAHRNQSAGWQG